MATAIENYLSAKMNMFDPTHVQILKDKFNTADENKIQSLYHIDLKDPGTVFLFAWFGFDRFILGDTGMAILKMVTAGGCGIWAIMDLFSAKKRTYEYNFKLINNIQV